MPRGTAPPAQRQVLFTTVTDGQTVADIRVCAQRTPSSGPPAAPELLLLDEFELAGIAPAPAASQQLVINFVLAADWSLHVSAQSRDGSASHSSQVVIRDTARGALARWPTSGPS